MFHDAIAVGALAGVVLYLLPVFQYIIREVREAYSPDEGDFQQNASPAPAPASDED
ncbi:hypothetical protein [Lysobacter sp. ESA13C]|uniref:hypothetical protein n=1 Tax=Lysobacter sp. ESA13C TaxID=2862676 RepID=UPI001CBE725E|nr:hypothetical protein [Lysobacter sp. ESA13C]